MMTRGRKQRRRRYYVFGGARDRRPASSIGVVWITLCSAANGRCAEGGDKLEMTIRPRGGNLHENRWRAAARPRVHSARIDVRCVRVCAWAYKPRELANRGWITVAERAACGRQTRHVHRRSARFFMYIYIMRVYFGTREGEAAYGQNGKTDSWGYGGKQKKIPYKRR